MKLIVAMIHHEKLEAIQEALSDTEACLMSVGEVCDLRHQRSNVYRGTEYRVSRPRLRLEIVVVNEMLVRDVVDAITRVAFTSGSRRLGGADVFVMNLDDWISIRGEDHPTPSRETECALHK
jgi:nitrogen regulatory protein PII